MKWLKNMSDDLYIDYHGIRVVLKTLPGNIKAFSCPNIDTYTIAVNNALGPAEQRDAVHHELEHIQNNDHFKEEYWEYA